MRQLCSRQARHRRSARWKSTAVKQMSTGKERSQSCRPSGGRGIITARSHCICCSAVAHASWQLMSMRHGYQRPVWIYIWQRQTLIAT